MEEKRLHTPEGVQDIYGERYRKKTWVEQRLMSSIDLYGYDAIQTPTLEFFDIFASDIGITPSRELYKFYDKDGNTLVLRSDFTPSIARCGAKYFSDSTQPVRLCYKGNTYTNNTNLQGKRKEATEIGAELLFDSTIQADAEMISLVIASLQAAGLRQFQISVGQVDFFKGLCEEAGLDEESESRLHQCISTKDFFAARRVIEESRVTKEYQEKLLRVADILGDMDSLSAAAALVSNSRSLAAIEGLRGLYECLRLYGVEDYVSFDLGLLSAHHYYTGVIFKAYTYGVGDAVVKGGRYDNLLQEFGKKGSAIGFVIVVDDLLEALDRQGCLPSCGGNAQTISYTEEDFPQCLQKAAILRKKGERVILAPAGTKDSCKVLAGREGRREDEHGR